MTSATVTPVAKVRHAVTMTVSPSWRQEHSAAAAENGSLRVSRSGDPSWLPISDDVDGSRCSLADFRKESGSAGSSQVGLGTLPRPARPPGGTVGLPPLPAPVKQTPLDSTARPLVSPQRTPEQDGSSPGWVETGTLRWAAGGWMPGPYAKLPET